MEELQDTFKDTKIGRIPKDWEVLNLKSTTDEITDFVAAGSFART